MREMGTPSQSSQDSFKESIEGRWKKSGLGAKKSGKNSPKNRMFGFSKTFMGHYNASPASPGLLEMLLTLANAL